MARSAASEPSLRARAARARGAFALGAGATILLAVLAVWPGRRASSSSLRSSTVAAGVVAPDASRPFVKSPAGVRELAAEAEESRPDPEAAHRRRLVAEMTDLMRRAEGLSADDVAEFQELATLTNEFDNGLTPEKASELVRHMPDGFLATPWGDLALRRWTRADRRAAAEWMAAHPDPSPVAATALMHDWFAQDGPGALAYVGGLPEGLWRTHVALSATEEALVAAEPAEALRFLAFSDAGHPRGQELQEWVALHWGRRSPAEASAWAARAESPELRDRLLAAVNVGRANADPLAAADDLLARVKNPAVVADALGSIVRIWAGKDAEAAARWVETFPAGPEKTRAAGQLLEIWSQSDPAAAARWRVTAAAPVN